MTDSSFVANAARIRQHAESTAESHTQGTRTGARSFDSAAAETSSLPSVMSDLQAKFDETIASLNQAVNQAMQAAESYQENLRASADAYDRTEQANVAAGKNIEV